MRALAVLVIVAIVGLFAYHVYLRTSVPADGSRPQAEAPAEQPAENAAASADSSQAATPPPAAAENTAAATEKSSDAEIPSSVIKEPEAHPRIVVYSSAPAPEEPKEPKEGEAVAKAETPTVSAPAAAPTASSSPSMKDPVASSMASPSNKSPATGGAVRKWKPVDRVIKNNDAHNADLEKAGKL